MNLLSLMPPDPSKPPLWNTPTLPSPPLTFHPILSPVRSSALTPATAQRLHPHSSVDICHRQQTTSHHQLLIPIFGYNTNSNPIISYCFWRLQPSCTRIPSSVPSPSAKTSIAYTVDHTNWRPPPQFAPDKVNLKLMLSKSIKSLLVDKLMLPDQ